MGVAKGKRYDENLRTTLMETSIDIHSPGLDQCYDPQTLHHEDRSSRNPVKFAQRGEFGTWKWVNSDLVLLGLKVNAYLITPFLNGSLFIIEDLGSVQYLLGRVYNIPHRCNG